MSISLSLIIKLLNDGGIIAYPTEAVYGLGCDPFNEDAVQRILALKQRSVSKGLILIAATWQQLQPYVQPIANANMQNVLATWPGPVTWLFPAAEKLPMWICGEHTSVAVRVTSHPIVQQLCTAFAKPLVSTSANIAGNTPAKDAATVKKIFPTGIDYIVAGQVGDLSKPTEIRDAISGKIIRAG